MLQDNVKECISEIKDAGINVMMLTGDNGTTAHQIAKQCLMVTNKMRMYRVNDDIDELKSELVMINK